MTISEVIAELRSIMNAHGDLMVVASDSERDGRREVIKVEQATDTDLGEVVVVGSFYNS